VDWLAEHEAWAERIGQQNRVRGNQHPSALRVRPDSGSRVIAFATWLLALLDAGMVILSALGIGLALAGKPSRSVRQRVRLTAGAGAEPDPKGAPLGLLAASRPRRCHLALGPGGQRPRRSVSLKRLSF